MRRLFTTVASLVGLATVVALGAREATPEVARRGVSFLDRALMMIGPAYSASMNVESLAATVSLRFYRIWSTAENDGRTLTVRTAEGGRTWSICGPDWAHFSRTSIYLTPGREIAVLGPEGCDFVVSLDPLTLAPVRNVPSADWTYLGAFGLARDDVRRDAARLRFAPAGEQAECIACEASELLPGNPARGRKCPEFLPGDRASRAGSGGDRGTRRAAIGEGER